MKFLIVCLFLGVTYIANSQSGTLKGVVSDTESGQPIIGATVIVSGQGVVSAEDGSFELSLTDGLYSVEASFIGYRSIQLQEVQVIGGKVTLLDIPMSPSTFLLNGVEVVERKPTTSPGIRRITEEQVNRFAATYYDVARLITNSSNVTVTNDQNNLVSVRGIPPAYNKWRLEGVEIVNPNHLSNAGTFSDQPTVSGGGVNMISAQMLSNSEFLFGAQSTRFGNSIAGNFNMALKNGASEHQYVFQSSFIGLDLAAEGPIGQSGATFSTNYRYSFTGVLNALGVDLGGEVIDFQDLAFNLRFPLKKGVLKFFAIGGLNNNDFSRLPPDEREEFKDNSDIDYSGKTALAGISYEWNLAGRIKAKTSLVYSTYDINRRQENFSAQEQSLGTLDTEFNKSILGFNHDMHWTQLNAGWDLNYYGDVRTISTNRSRNRNSFYLTPGTNGDFSQLLFRPYANYTFQFGNRLSVTPGITAILSDRIDSVLLDLRVEVAYQVNRSLRLAGGVGEYSQFDEPISRDIALIGFSLRASDLYPSLSAEKYSLTASGNIGGGNPGSSNSGIDYVMEYFYYDFENLSFTQRVIASESDYSLWGLALDMDKQFSNEYSYSAGLSYLEWDGIRNEQLNANVSVGKEFSLNSNENTNTLGVNARYTEQLQLRTGGYTNDFSRLDLRVMWKKVKVKSVQTLALDIQNVLNTKNLAFNSFEGFGTEEYQLGLLPIISYRFDF